MATITSWTATAISAALALKANLATSLQTTSNLNDVANKATARTNLNLPQRPWFDVRDYGATGNGTTDDAASINNAIAAAATAGGGIVYLPPGTYSVTAGIVLTADRIILRGAGKSTIIKPTSGANYDVISTPIPATEGTAGYIHYYLGVENLAIDCSLATGTTAGKGNGIHFYGVRYSHIRDVNITTCLNWGILLDGDITNFSYSIDVRGNKIINGSAGIMVTFSEEAFITCNDILQANLTTAAQQPSFGTQSNVGYLVRFLSGYSLLMGNVIGSSGSHTSAAVQVENSGPTRIEGNRFDQCRYQAIRTTAPNTVIIGNQIGNPSSVGSVEGIKLGSAKNTVIGNIFDISNGAAHWTYCIAEPSAQSDNIIMGNQLLPGTSGVVNLSTSSTKCRASGNTGYNPVGTITAPSMPSSTTDQFNVYGVDVEVFITGGTVTVINIDGNPTGLTSGSFKLAPGQKITITYSSAPTWKWFGY